MPRKVGPGLYLNGDQLEIDVPELLRHFGYADTPENRETCQQAALAAFKQQFPGVPRYVTSADEPRPRKVED